ncbi:response regulator transcription factor [Sinorhizobium sp. BG8]|uniref:response regulator transcription factor n=1 Tax=Sinorhizobium sp. BG8 TaxID=2613773 RepID=UPI001FEFF8AD|nr:response regulator transcription factor [Sinorhizobium sp. BG8]
MPRTSAVIADDHPLVLRGLVNLLANEPDFDVVAAASDGKSAFQEILSRKPDLAVLDILMPNLSGLDVLRELNRMKLSVKVIFLTAFISEEQNMQATAMGARGILLKESAPEALVECMRAVGKGSFWLPSKRTAETSEQKDDSSRSFFDSFCKLTGREKEISYMVAEGYSNKQIASLLNVSEGTVKIHVHNIFSKLNIFNRTTLAAKIISLKT